jgi:hypothetical protein
MSVYLYRLYAVQSFNGEKIAVYTCEGNYPDGQILSDATDIVEGTRTRKEVLEYHDWMYNPKEVYPESGNVNRNRLTYYTRLLKRSQKVVDENKNVDKAIFVNSTNKKEWRGERTLYENKVFDTIKSDTPEYTGCTPIGTITI